MIRCWTMVATVWLVAATLLGAAGVRTGAWAAEKPAAKSEKPAAQKPAPKKPAPKPEPAAPAPKESPKVETKPTPADIATDDEVGETDKGDPKGAAAGLPIPRFVSLRTNPINLRTGPGVRYPVDWVYVRRHLPVEVIGEFDTWRQIRDVDGTEGWVHQSMLSGKRSAVITKDPRPLKRTGEDAAETIATLERGVIVNVQRCPAETSYCRVEVDGLQGWMKRDQFWGVYPNEILN